MIHLQEGPPLEKWLHPEVCTRLCVEMCKIVALEAPGTLLRRQAEVGSHAQHVSLAFVLLKNSCTLSGTR